jgi:hypothetical protein
MTYAQGEIEQGSRTGCEAHIFELADLDQFERKSGFRNQSGLKASGGADKPYLGAMRVAKLSSDSQSRNHVTTSSTSSY